MINRFLATYPASLNPAIVGVSNLLISLITYYVLIFFSINYQIANIVGFITGTINGYIWNRLWVFKNKEQDMLSIVRFYLTYLATWLLSAVLLYAWIEIFNISNIIAPIINVVITTPINYILNKTWVFKKTNQ